MTEQTRAILNVLDDALCQQDDTAEELLAIIMSIRSNDGGHGALKSCGTVPVRRAAFPKLAAVADQLVEQHRAPRKIEMQMTLEEGSDGGKFDMRVITRRPSTGQSWQYKEITKAEGHYIARAKRAASILKLKIVQ